jgi:hypothetical protein
MKKRTVNVDDLLCLVTVPCSDEQHRIALTTGGALVFYDHVDDNLKIEEDLRITGDLEPSCKCAHVYRAWVNNDRWQLPEPLDHWRAQVAAGKHRPGRGHVDRRIRRGDAAKRDPLEATTVRQRAEARVLAVAYQTIKKATYRRGEYEHSNKIAIVPRRKAGVGVESESFIRNECRRVKTYFTIRLPLRWLVRVHQRGLSLVETKKGTLFVLDTIGPQRRDGSQLLRVVKQSRGYKLKVATALLTRRGALRWL